MKPTIRMTLLAATLGVALFLSGCATGPDDLAIGSQEMVADRDESAVGMPPPPSPSRLLVEALNTWDDHELAIDLYSRIIEISPDLALAYYQRAELLRKTGSPERAVDDYTRAIEAEPGFLQAYLERGFLRMWELGDEAGREDIELAYAIDPNDVPTALAMVGMVEWEEPERAFEILDRLTNEFPDDPGPYLHRAKIHRNHGDYEASAADFAAAIERGLNEPWIRAERAMVLLANGDLREARRETELAAEWDPNSPDVALIRARLSVLAGEYGEAADLYSIYLDSEWIHQPVKLEAAYLAAATGNESVADLLIRSYREMEDDPLRAEIAMNGLSYLTPTGDVEAAAMILADVTINVDWYESVWVMLAAVMAVEPDALPAGRAAELAPEIEQRIQKIRPEFKRLIVDNTELMVWLRLYGERHPELGALGFPGF